MESEFKELMPHTIVVRPYVDRDGYAKPTYGDPVSYAALVCGKQKLVIDRQGKERVTTTVAYVEGPAVIGPEDRVTLPDGTFPPIIAVSSNPDETGEIHNCEVYF